MKTLPRAPFFFRGWAAALGGDGSEGDGCDATLDVWAVEDASTRVRWAAEGAAAEGCEVTCAVISAGAALMPWSTRDCFLEWMTKDAGDLMEPVLKSRSAFEGDAAASDAASTGRESVRGKARGVGRDRAVREVLAVKDGVA